MSSSRRSTRSSANSSKADSLAKIRQLKGKKNKYQLKEEAPVYDEIDEDEYCNLVVKRQKEDWIVDDGLGYVEDGREIFDDEHMSSDDERPARARKASKKHKVTIDSPSTSASTSTVKEKKHDIRNLFIASKEKSSHKPTSFKQSTEGDDNLESILNDLNNVPVIKPKALKRVSGHAAIKRAAAAAAVDVDALLGDVKPKEAKIEDGAELFDDFDEGLPPTSPEPESSSAIWSQPTTKQDHAPQTVVVEDVENEMKFESKDGTDDKFLDVFWFDIAECPGVPGKVYLFGKTPLKDSQNFATCCIVIPDVKKRIFFLPRVISGERVSTEEVELELKQRAKKLKMSDFTAKKVTRKYAFEFNYVPREETEYLEVMVSPSAQITSDLQGDTFAAVFGWSQTAAERVLLECKLRGPGWLRLRNPSVSPAPVSWCKPELVVSGLEDVIVNPDKVEPIPPITLLGIATRTFKNAKTGNTEVIAVSCFVNQNFNPIVGSNKPSYDSHFCIICKPPANSGVILPYDASKIKMATKLEIKSSEREMLNFLMAKLAQIDPDVIVGHDLLDNDLAFLSSRMFTHKIATWSRLGRLRRTIQPQKRERTSLTTGRLIADIKIAARELIKSRSYDLTELAKQVGRDRRECDLGNIAHWFNNSKNLTAYIDHLMNDNDISMRLLLSMNVLPLVVQITRVAGNSLGKTLLGGRSERNELLLLHAFHEAGYICPDKSNKKTTADKDTYTGGLVLEPKVDLYTTFVVVLDFNSLYPSIIREFNLCFTTVNPEKPDPPSEDVLTGILPQEISKLVESRREVKQLMEKASDASEKVVLDIKQMALKLTANSMYGCLGFSSSRFYAAHLAALITSKGRELLVQTKNLVETQGFEVVYGDTDSLMIDTRVTSYPEAIRIATQLVALVNGRHRHLVIGLDHVFRKLLLLKKKKYAALVSSRDGKCHREYKGLDIVRRDWSTISKNAGDQVLQILLAEDAKADEVADKVHEYLRHLSENLMKRPLEEFLIYKELSKDPDDYRETGKSLAHVLVALKFNQECKDGRLLRAGDVVPFLVCRHETDEEFNKLSHQQRAIHPDLKTQQLEPDKSYYLEQQIYPVVSRLLAPIQGTDARSVAEFLGISTSFAPSVKKEEAIPAGKDRYASCDPIPVTCPTCKSKLEIREPVKSCSVCQENLLVSSNVKIQFKLYLRKIIRDYYNGWFICDDCGCKIRWPLPSWRDRSISCPDCSNGNLVPEITAAELFRRLSFIERMAGPELAPMAIDKRQYLAFERVNLSSLFSFIK